MIALPHAKAYPLSIPVPLLDLRDAIERLARRRGHDDPSDFFGGLALELV
jgi:N-glycosylase/DNA lyase